MADANYVQYNQLYDKYGSQGFNVLAFPCAQFFNQEPGRNNEILNILEYVRPGNGYTPKFQMFSKIEVNGQNADPIYQFLKSRCGPTASELTPRQFISWDTVTISDITWNYEKFLINKSGVPIRRYSPNTEPLLIEKDILRLLKDN